MVCCNLVAKLLFILFSNNKRDSGLPTEIIANTKMCITIMFQLECAGEEGGREGCPIAWDNNEDNNNNSNIVKMHPGFLTLCVCVCLYVSVHDYGFIYR